MDLNKPVDLEQFHEELSIMRHLEKMNQNNTKDLNQDQKEEAK